MIQIYQKEHGYTTREYQIINSRECQIKSSLVLDQLAISQFLAIA